MNIALWIVQVLLALAFAMAGFTKLATPFDQLAAQMPWVTSVPSFVPALAGASEVLGAIGLILPSALRVAPAWTPRAAIGLALVMLLAAGLHASRGEAVNVVVNAVLLGLALFVAYGRTKLSVIVPKGS